jgi:hypothetical protein
MSNLSRLEKLEKQFPPSNPHPPVVCVDADGIILDDMTAVAKPWIGKHLDELLAAASPDCVQALVGVNPSILYVYQLDQ